MIYEAVVGSGSELFVTAYILAAFLTGLGFIYLSTVWQTVPKKFALIHFFIVTWSGLMYLNFIGRKTFMSDYAWYLDWMISTPLIVLALGLTATVESDQDHTKLITALLGLQFMMIVTGLISQETQQVNAYAFWVGCGLLVGVLYLLWKPIREIAYKSSEMLGTKYDVLAAYISGFFILYPAIWYLGTPGPMNTLTDFQTSVAFVILPFFCKQVFGFLDLYMIKKVT